MLEWLNTYVGTEWATYHGLIIGIVGVGVGLYGLNRLTPIVKNKINNKKVNQSAKQNHGDVIQAGRDVNSVTNNHYTGINEDAELQKKKYQHDLKIIDEILTLLPYDKTIDEAERSHIVGMLYQFSLDLENAEKYTDVKYKLFNITVDDVKNKFIKSVKAFNESSSAFLAVDHPNREPLRLDLPYNWKNNGEKSEMNYRKHQRDMRETSGVMIDCYRNFVETIKQHDFITDKL